MMLVSENQERKVRIHTQRTCLDCLGGLDHHESYRNKQMKNPVNSKREHIGMA